MRALRGRHRNPRIVGMKILAVKRERLRLTERRAQIIDELERRRFALAVVEPKRPEVIGVDAGNKPKLHPPAEHLIDDGDFFGQPQRMIERHDVAHRTDAQPLGARPGTDRIKRRRRHPALVGPEMMLDAERIIETKFVAGLKLAPQLLVALMRRHSGLGPDVGEVGKFHGDSVSSTIVTVPRFAASIAERRLVLAVAGHLVCLCPREEQRIRRGKFSRDGFDKKILRFFEKRDDLMSRHRRKAAKKVIDGFSRFQIVQ